MPSLFAENALDLPSGASPRSSLKPMNGAVEDITATPPASAISHSPCRIAWQARCMATREEEHAVSTVTAAPSRPRVYATRPDTTLAELPMVK
ncbi:putative protein OS=Streptomyces antimycoticus OX=68175 GN=SANT12839_037260 PE=4 SV=1 [Streptomyces antimycoticus]